MMLHTRYSNDMGGGGGRHTKIFSEQEMMLASWDRICGYGSRKRKVIKEIGMLVCRKREATNSHGWRGEDIGDDRKYNAAGL